MKTFTNRILMLVTLALGLGFGVTQPANAGSFVTTGSMGSARASHTATLLLNGKVLVAGGSGGGYGASLASAELYDPATGTWSPTGAMKFNRRYHTATLLGDGKVLVVGGFDGYSGWRVAELYDPATGTWSDTGTLSATRYFHTATLLSDGKVLVVGGSNGLSDNSSTELYNPGTGTWSASGNMSIPRRYHTATLLGNGKVLAAGTYGGYSGTSGAEIYDPASKSWAATGAMSNRSQHTTTLLPNGKALAAGGYGNGALSSAEVFDPANGTWSLTGAMGSIWMDQTATLLADGKVLVVGGSRDYNVTIRAELYNPATETWVETNSLGKARIYHAATLLQNGRVLVSGGSTNGSNSLSSAELYDPSPSATFSITLNAAVNGTVTGNTSPYPPNSTAVLTAIPSPGYIFTGWTGDAIGTTNPLSILMNSDQRIGVNFTSDTNDDDADGLTNHQELVTWHTNPKAGDTDGDGFLDGYEVLTGKSPLNPLDRPALVAGIASAVEFIFPSAIGKNYRIESSFDLSNWTLVESGIAGTGGQIQRFYSLRNMPKRYFRVEEITQ